MKPDRRQIADLVTRYTLEPTLRDVYVEGPSDHGLIDWFASEHGLHRAVPFEIDTVDVPAATVLALGLPDNKRGRVLTMAHVLEGELGAGAPQVLFIVDSDFDRLFELEHRARPATKQTLVQRTDFAAMEMYLFRDDVLRKLFCVACGVRGVDINLLRSALIVTLRWLFCFRAAIETTAPGVGMLSVDGDLAVDGAGFTFDNASFVHRCLNASARLRDKATILAELSKHMAAAVGDERHFMHGHDFLAVVTWFIRTHCRALRSTKPEAIEATVWACCETRFFAGHALFGAIQVWARS